MVGLGLTKPYFNDDDWAFSAATKDIAHSLLPLN